MQTKTYTGKTGTEAYNGYAGLTLGTTYTGEEREGRVHLVLPTGRTTSVTLEQWREWFE